MANIFSSDPNCVALWKFESGALTTDSKGTNTLTDNNTVGTETTDYKEGSACAECAVANTEYFSVADADLDAGFPLKSGDTNKKISICGWVKAATLPSDQGGIVSKYDTNSKRSFMVRFNDAFELYLGYNSGVSGEILYTGGIPATGRWYHFGFTFDDSDKSWKFVVWDDTAGSKVVNTSGTATNNIFVGDAPLGIGVEYFATGTPAYPLDGLIDEVVVFNDVLIADEIDAIRAGTYQYDVNVSATCQSLTMVTYPMTMAGDTTVNASYSALTITTYDAYVFGGPIQAAVASLIISSHAATVGFHVSVQAITVSLEISAIDAQVLFGIQKSISETASIYETLSLAYGKTVTSTAAITDEVTADLGLHVTEWLGAKDTVDSQWTGVETLSETLMLVALSIQQKLYRETVAESAACAETLTPEVSILVKEWLNAVDTVASTFTGTMTISEALRAVDEAIAQRLYQSTVEETMAAADVATAGKIVRAVIAVTGAIADTASDSYIANPAIVEAMSLIDAVADKFMPLETVQETFAAVATVLETPYFNNIITESWTLADTIAFAWSDTVTESLSVVDSLSLKWTAILSITEALIATETVFGQLEYSDSIAEALSLVDAVLVNQILGLAITEILEAGVTVRLADESWEAWVINTNKFFPSVYSNYEFDSYAVYGNAAFGCKDDGVYELSGATDNGTTIQAGIVLPETSFGTSREKRFRKAYFGISGTSPAIRMETDNGSETYTISNDKANIGRNLKGKEWVLKVASFDSLDFVELVQIILTR